MNTLKAVAMKYTAVKNQQPMMFFDWEKAALFIKKHKPIKALAGLKDDFEWTGNTIYQDGKPLLVDEDGEQPYTFLGSCWAIPLLIIEDERGYQDEIECYTLDPTRGYDTHSYWPPEALALLN